MLQELLDYLFALVISLFGLCVVVALEKEEMRCNVALDEGSQSESACDAYRHCETSDRQEDSGESH